MYTCAVNPLIIRIDEESNSGYTFIHILGRKSRKGNTNRVPDSARLPEDCTGDPRGMFGVLDREKSGTDDTDVERKRCQAEMEPRGEMIRSTLNELAKKEN